MFEERRKKLVNHLLKSGYIKTEKVKKAFLEVPREYFVDEEYKNQAYFDTPLQIGSGQTISAPHMVAIMCEALDIKDGQNILEIGTGSGYHAAIVAKMIGDNGNVFTVERFEKLSKKAKNNLKKANIKNVTINVSDGSEGLLNNSPYDRIYVTCAAPDIPKPLINQLKNKGKLLIPVGRTLCKLVLLEKNDNQIKEKYLGGCAFVPLIGKYGHKVLR